MEIARPTSSRKLGIGITRTLMTTMMKMANSRSRCRSMSDSQRNPRPAGPTPDAAVAMADSPPDAIEPNSA
jgi:hypothetical protein